MTNDIKGLPHADRERVYINKNIYNINNIYIIYILIFSYTLHGRVETSLMSFVICHYFWGALETRSAVNKILQITKTRYLETVPLFCIFVVG